MAKLAPSGYQAPYPAHEAVIPQGAVIALALVGVQYRDDDAELHAHVLPAYRRGVAHLVAHPEETNCLSARLVEDIAVDGGPRPQVDSETFAWFRSLADLEAWTHHHPTHEDIFSRFGAMAAALDFKIGTLLGHEVYVVPAGAAEAVYVNCHPATGLLPFLDSAEV